MFAVRKQIPYLGVCFTQTHIDLLYSKLRSRILSAAMDANDFELYDVNLASLVTSSRKDATPTKDSSGASPSAGIAEAAGGSTPAAGGGTPAVGSGAGGG